MVATKFHIGVRQLLFTSSKICKFGTLEGGTLHIISSNSPRQYFSPSAKLTANKKQLSCTANLHSLCCSSDQSSEERSRSQETVPAVNKYKVSTRQQRTAGLTSQKVRFLFFLSFFENVALTSFILCRSSAYVVRHTFEA